MNFPFKSILSSFLLFTLFLLVGCTSQPQKKEEIYENIKFIQSSFEQVPLPSNTSWSQALEAFKLSCRSLGKKKEWKTVCDLSKNVPAQKAESFFKSNFTPWSIVSQKIGEQSKKVLSEKNTGTLTGYYEPVLFVDTKKTSVFSTPILSTPEDLVIVDLSSLYPKLKGMRLRGKLEGRVLRPYDSRVEIIKRKDLEKYAIAWSNDPVEVFFLQVQGSGRLQTKEGHLIRIGYDDQNGHPYRAIGSWLVKKGYLKKSEISMQSIQNWANSNPGQVETLLGQNPSFVFFKVRNDIPSHLGPAGAMGIPLTPTASIAVDPKFIPLGAPMIFSASQKNPEIELVKAVVAQDTGGAIKGVLRFDYFIGFGDEAGSLAGRLKSSVAAWLLLPNTLTPSP